MTRKLKAFSMIELSIVLIAIVLLLVGAVTSTRIVDESRLRTAQSITESGPALSIKDLILWYDTTMERSFLANEVDEDQPIGSWYDLNYTSVSRITATSSGSARPTYQRKCINDLPCLVFDGSDDYMDTADLQFSSTSLTYFAVIQPTTISATHSILMTSGLYADNAVHFQVNSDATFQYSCFNGTQLAISTTNLSANSPYILTAIDDNSEVKLYNKGTSVSTESTTAGSKTLGVLSIGSYDDGTRGDFFNGYIGEIIIYGRNLTDSERRSIENYLSRKWNITLTN